MLPLFVVLACGGKDTEGLKVATFNAGLAVGFVDGAEDRAPKVAAAIPELDADVVCLEEVWAPEHVAAIEDAAADAFPNQSFAEPMQGDSSGEPACADGDLDELLACLGTNCSDACQDELVDCVLASCTGQFLELPKTCQGCTMANVGGTPDEIQTTCETQSTSYAYGGSFGTGILSAYAFAGEPEHTVFESTTNRRGAHHAVIEAPTGDVDFYCTHLTPVFVTIPYPRDTGSWTEEQAAQIDTLRAWVEDTKQTDTVILAGDFNTGPALSGIDGEVPAAYDALADGYDNFYIDGNPDCTFCEDNPLVSDLTSVLIDHVLVKGFESGTGERLFTDAIETVSCGETIDARLSDHYGLELTLE